MVAKAKRERRPRIDAEKLDAETAALVRLQNACVNVSGILDTGARDPTWHESQELENASIEYGRILRSKSS